MRSLHLLALTLSALLGAASVQALPAQEDAAQEQPVLTRDQLRLLTYEPVWRNAHSLLQVLDGQGWYRTLRIRESGETTGEGDLLSVDNMTVLEGDLLLYDRPERVDAILAVLAELDRKPAASREDAPEPALELYTAQHLDARTLRDNLILFMPEANSPEGAHAGERQVLVETEDRTGQVILRGPEDLVNDALSLLRALDRPPARAGDGSEQNPSPEVLIYRPRAVSLQGLQAALQSFIRPFRYYDEQGQPVQVSTNITWSFQDGILTIRDFPDQVQRMRSVLERIDQPAPQALLSCMILKGRDDEQGSAPAELSDALREILPYRSYSVEATGAVRLALRTGSEIGLTMSALPAEGRPESFVLNAAAGAWDDERQALTLNRCQVSVTGYGDTAPGPGGQQIFRTDTTVYAGEYAVLGVAGGEPLFVVLRLLPVDAPAAR